MNIVLVQVLFDIDILLLKMSGFTLLEDDRGVESDKQTKVPDGAQGVVE